MPGPVLDLHELWLSLRFRAIYDRHSISNLVNWLANERLLAESAMKETYIAIISMDYSVRKCNRLLAAEFKDKSTAFLSIVDKYENLFITLSDIPKESFYRDANFQTNLGKIIAWIKFFTQYAHHYNVFKFISFSGNHEKCFERMTKRRSVNMFYQYMDVHKQVYKQLDLDADSKFLPRLFPLVEPMLQRIKRICKQFFRQYAILKSPSETEIDRMISGLELAMFLSQATSLLFSPEHCILQWRSFERQIRHNFKLVSNRLFNDIFGLDMEKTYEPADFFRLQRRWLRLSIPSIGSYSFYELNCLQFQYITYLCIFINCFSKLMILFVKKISLMMNDPYLFSDSGKLKTFDTTVTALSYSYRRSLEVLNIFTIFNCDQIANVKGKISIESLIQRSDELFFCTSSEFPEYILAIPKCLKESPQAIGNLLNTFGAIACHEESDKFTILISKKHFQETMNLNLASTHYESLGLISEVKGLINDYPGAFILKTHCKLKREELMKSFFPEVRKFISRPCSTVLFHLQRKLTYDLLSVLIKMLKCKNVNFDAEDGLKNVCSMFKWHSILTTLVYTTEVIPAASKLELIRCSYAAAIEWLKFRHPIMEYKGFGMDVPEMYDAVQSLVSLTMHPDIYSNLDLTMIRDTLISIQKDLLSEIGVEQRPRIMLSDDFLEFLRIFSEDADHARKTALLQKRRKSPSDTNELKLEKEKIENTFMSAKLLMEKLHRAPSAMAPNHPALELFVNAADGKYVIKKRTALDEIDNFQRLEIYNSFLISHGCKNIVKVYGCFSDGSNFYTLMEFCKRGNMCKLLEGTGVSDEQKFKQYSRQILNGLKKIHDLGFVHMDVKPDNIVLGDDDELKLIDFGSILIKNLSPFNSSCLVMNRFSGTPYYVSPEVIRNAAASDKSDIWSFGCTLIYLLTGKRPWIELKNSMSALFSLGVNGITPQVTLPEGKNFSPEAIEFIKACLVIDKNLRPCAAELLTHPYLSN